MTTGSFRWTIGRIHIIAIKRAEFDPLRGRYLHEFATGRFIKCGFFGRCKLRECDGMLT